MGGREIREEAELMWCASVELKRSKSACVVVAASLQRDPRRMATRLGRRFVRITAPPVHFLDAIPPWDILPVEPDPGPSFTPTLSSAEHGGVAGMGTDRMLRKFINNVENTLPSLLQAMTPRHLQRARIPAAQGFVSKTIRDTRSRGLASWGARAARKWRRIDTRALAERRRPSGCRAGLASGP